MKRIRLDQDAVEIQLAKQLLEHGTLVVGVCGVAGLGQRHPKGSGVDGDLGHVDAVGRRP